MLNQFMVGWWLLLLALLCLWLGQWLLVLLILELLSAHVKIFNGLPYVFLFCLNIFTPTQ